MIDRHDQHQPHITTEDDLARGLATVQPLLSLGGEELGRFCAVMRGAHYAALLATADEMIVKQCCHAEDADQFRSCGVIPGGDLWDLFERQCLPIHALQRRDQRRHQKIIHPTSCRIEFELTGRSSGGLALAHRRSTLPPLPSIPSNGGLRLFG
jgi:hypothetical protein